MTVHEMQKSNRVKKTKVQKIADVDRMQVAFIAEHDALSNFCTTLWDYEWRVEHIGVGDFTKLIDTCEKVCAANRMLNEELVADNYHNDETGEYDGVNVTLRSSYGE